jgi:hypothetical protein
METRVCSKCGIAKPVEEFRLRNRFTKRRQSHCTDCGSKMGADWYERNKEQHALNVRANTKNAKQAAREFVYQYRLTHPCTGCGESDPAVLEFHHVGEKDKEVGRMIAQGYGTDAITREISQCLVLCANCHRRLTAKEKGWYKWRE